MTKNTNKDTLFDDFYSTAQATFGALESQFGIQGVLDQVFGTDLIKEESKVRVRSSRAWETLSTLYEYAINGIQGGKDPMDIVIDGADVVHLIESENYRPCEEWDTIIRMADGRYALDEGNVMNPQKLALLANVDIRTVRNAMSAGELVSYKREEAVWIENASARRWLHRRKGFKPTVMDDDSSHLNIENVRSPADFGGFLISQRKRIGLNSESEKLAISHPSVNPHAVSEIEAGVFALPLDAVFPIADFYQISRQKLLECVMRVFFYEELQMISADTGEQEKQS
jgi:hypothetical protein